MSWNWVQVKLGTDNWHNVAWLNGIIPRKAFAEEDSDFQLQDVAGG